MTPNRQPDKVSGGRRFVAWVFQVFTAFAVELRGAIHDHRMWINSPRARVLDAGFDLSSKVFSYGAYIAFGLLAFSGWQALHAGLAANAYGAAISFGDTPQTAVFIILATGLLAPIVLIGGYILAGLLYNLARAGAYRVLPRFAKPIAHPAIVWVLFGVLSSQQDYVFFQLGRTYVNAKATVTAALPGKVQTHVVRTEAETPGEVEADRLRLWLMDRVRCERDDEGTRRCEVRREPVAEP